MSLLPSLLLLLLPALITLFPTKSRHLIHSAIALEQGFMTSLLGVRYVYVVRVIHCNLLRAISRLLRLVYLRSDPSSATGVTYYTLRSSPPLAEGFVTHLYAHGGGYCMHTETEVMAALLFLRHSPNSRICLAGYPLCPAHDTDAALSSVRSLYAAASSESPSGVVVSGDSAGANLVLRLLLSLDEPPLGAVLISPWLDCTSTTSPLTPRAFPPPPPKRRDFMNPRFVASLRSLVSRSSPDHPSLSDLLLSVKGRPSLLRRSLILTGKSEGMHGEALALRRASGGAADVFAGEDGAHDFCLSGFLGDAGVNAECWRVVAEKVEGWRADFSRVSNDGDDADARDGKSDDEGGGESVDKDDMEGYEDVKEWVDGLGKGKGRS